MARLSELLRTDTGGGAYVGNPNLARQALRARAATAAPTSVMDPGYDKYKANLNDAEQLTVLSDLLLGGAAVAPAAARHLGPVAARAAEDYLRRSGLILDATPKGFVGPVTTDPVAARVIEKFGQKHEKEAALARRIEMLADRPPPAEVARTGDRTALPPDVFRQLQARVGPEAALADITKNKIHIKRNSDGTYVGFPRTITSPQGIAAFRRGMDENFADAAEAIKWADPNRTGTWYDRAKLWQAATNEPYQLDRSLGMHGAYSAGVAPDSELGFTLKHLNSRALGEPAMAYRGAPMRMLDSAVANDRPANLAFKTGEYANHNDPRIPNAGLFGVNDFRAAQGFGYTHPDGTPWRAGVSDAMHPVMDAETAMLLARTRANAVGGRTDWQGPQIQEVPWVYGKAQDQYYRGVNGRYAGPPEEGIRRAIQDANNTFGDYLYKHTASATHEAVPGASTGHVPQMLNAPLAEREAYSRAGRWDVPAEELRGGPIALGDIGAIGAGPRDALYSAIGLRQLPSLPSTGLYRNSAGVVERNPMTIARPLVDYPTGGGGGRMSPLTQDSMAATERFRAAMDAQEAGAFNLPNTMASATGEGNKTAMVLDRRTLTEPTTGEQLNADQLARITDVLDRAGLGGSFGVTNTSRGGLVFPFMADEVTPVQLKALRGLSPVLGNIVPGARVQRGVATTGYVPGIGKWGANGVEPTAPFSGEATAGVLEQFAGVPQRVSQSLSESERIRAILRDKIARDAQVGGARLDIQNMRNFFSEADWAKAVDMIRKGATPAAAVAALGYSINSMAGDQPR